MSVPQYSRLPFAADGTLHGSALADLVETVKTDGVENLFVFSHGWGNTVEHAEQNCEQLFPLIADAAAGKLDGVGFAGVFWPSIWFPDASSADAPDVADAVAHDRPGAANAALSGAQLASALKETLPAAAHDDVTKLGELVDHGLHGSATDDEQRTNLQDFRATLQKVTATSVVSREDNGERGALETADPVEDYQRLAAVTGSAVATGNAQGILDPFKKAWNGAKDVLRVFSFYEMKGRAGDIGAHGLAPVLVALHGQVPGLRVHLLGHSFGARLVSYSLKGIPSPATSPVASLTLIQGAFSHWAFDDRTGEHDRGGLVGRADRVHGPLAATFSTKDWAVGKWYPRASFLASDSSQAAEDATSRWGGMGSDGFQGAIPLVDVEVAPGRGLSGPLAAGHFHRVDCNAVVKDTSPSSFSGAHSDIFHPEIASIVVAAATPAA